MDRYVAVSLKNTFNHKVFLENQVADKNCGYIFHDDRVFYKLQSKPEDNKGVIAFDVPFTMHNTEDGYFDNTTCEEQSITVPQGKYKHIYYLGVYETGFITENVRLIFDDGSEENVSLCLEDFRPLFFGHNRDKACRRALKIIDGSDLAGNISMYDAAIKNSDRILKTIVLPYDPSIHLFAITLERL